MVYLIGEAARTQGLENKYMSLDKIVKGFVNKTSFTGTLFEEEFFSEMDSLKKEKKDLAYSLLTEVPIGSEGYDIDDAIKEVVRSYLTSDLEAKYDTIKPGIFDLEHFVKINHDESRGEVKIPLFARTKIDDEEWNWEKEVKLKSNDGYTADYEVNISSTVPLIPKEAKEKIREFTSDYMKVVSKAYEDPLIGNLLMKYSNLPGTGPPSIMISWIPKPSEMNISVKPIDPDPILDASFFGKNFLIYDWVSKDESPYQHYLREFQESKGQRPGLN